MLLFFFECIQDFTELASIIGDISKWLFKNDEDKGYCAFEVSIKKVYKNSN